MKVPQNLIVNLRSFFEKKFPDFQEIWEDNYLSFIFKHNTFTLKVESPVRKNSKEKLLPLASRQIYFFLLSDHSTEKCFEWRSSRIDLNMAQLLAARIDTIKEFVLQIEICKDCRKAYPFPYLTGIRGQRRNNKDMHFFQLKCPSCDAIFNPTKDSILESRCNYILKHTRGDYTIKKEGAIISAPIPDEIKQEEPMKEEGDLLLKEVVIGMHSDDVINPHFKISRKKSCNLGMQDFEGSVLPGKLKCMFFEGSHLKLSILKNSCALETTDVMDCKLSEKNKDAIEMKVGTKYELTSNVSYVLAIDDVLYSIKAVA